MGQVDHPSFVPWTDVLKNISLQQEGLGNTIIFVNHIANQPFIPCVLPKLKNYERYYRSARQRVLTSFEQFFLYVEPFSLSTLVNLGLSQSISTYFGLARFILNYFNLSFSISGYLELPCTFLYKNLILWAISGYFKVSQTIINYLGHTCILA